MVEFHKDPLICSVGNLVERGVILERNTHGTLVLTARHFGPKRTFFSCKFKTDVLMKLMKAFCICNCMKKALLGLKRLAVRTSVPLECNTHICVYYTQELLPFYHNWTW